MAIASSIIAAGIGAAGAAVASRNSRKGTQAAANQANQANATNNALQQNIYNQNQAALQPFINQGGQYTGQINALLASNPYQAATGDKFTEDPGYQYIRDQAMESVNAQNALRGSRLSGGALTRLQDRATGIASTGYGDWWNRDQAKLANINNSRGNYLSAMQGQQNVGVGAASALAGVGQNFANNVGQNNWQAAQVQGNAALANANQQNSLLNNLLGTGANLYGQWQQNRSSYAPAQGYSQGPIMAPSGMWGLY